LAMGAFAVGQALQANRYLRPSGIRTKEAPRAALTPPRQRPTKPAGSVFTPPTVRFPAHLPLVPPPVRFPPHLRAAPIPQALLAAPPRRRRRAVRRPRP